MTDSELLASFRREENGDWTCIKPVLMDGTVRNMAFAPGARVSHVDMFMGVDVARKLDEAASRQETKAEIRTPIHH
ncbi:MAG: hypothetical protein H6917_10310 [Novosphingobium sp.]|nr:hypothetical protein [Novosphingobium sp.]MCP5402764.1 hypothetical protein [Novosphingobium sp.]